MQFKEMNARYTTIITSEEINIIYFISALGLVSFFRLLTRLINTPIFTEKKNKHFTILIVLCGMRKSWAGGVKLGASS